MVIEYASSESGASVHPGLALAATPMLWTAILSGLCVASCFVTFTQHPLAAFSHVCNYVMIFVSAGMAGTRYRPPGAAARTVQDIIASVGLMGIMIAPVLFLTYTVQSMSAGPFALGACFLLIAATTSRHLMLYSAVSNALVAANRRGLARSFLVMGWVKMIYEGLWLMCCALPLMMYQDRSMGREEDVAVFLAFGALFGCFGFGLIWIWMIIAHAMLVATVKRQGKAIMTALAQPVMAVS